MDVAANAVIYVENIRKALVKLDPANAATYDANATAYTAKFKAIEAAGAGRSWSEFRRSSAGW